MNARDYARLTAAITAAWTPEQLDALRDLVARAELRPLQRQALERLLRARADALRGGDSATPAGGRRAKGRRVPGLRCELFEGERWLGDYPNRLAAMADAELLAAKRGQTLAWGRLSEDSVVGTPHPAGERPPFTVRTRPAPRGTAGGDAAPR